jgi:ADP-heptose:LPS heptosyltransferase
LPYKILVDFIFFQSIFFFNTIGFKRAFYDSVIEIFSPKYRSEFYRLARQVFANVKMEEYAYPKIPGLTTARSFHEGCKNFVVFPFGKMQCNKWSLDRYVRLISKLIADGHKITVIGGIQDADSLDHLRDQLGNKVSIECELDFLKLSNLLKSVHYYIGSDSGPMHLSAIHGVRCCAIFSDRDRLTDWRPFGFGHKIIKSNMVCGGCMLQTCYANPSECLDRVTVDSVYNQIGIMLTDEVKI